jgi:redox-sensitive bicupin YhaK (pirin superfamily)
MQTIQPVTRDIGDLSVKRVLPSANRRSVGPFVFFDHFGPAAFPPGEGIQVRPHPHIGLATVTYLFDGEIIHRDSLGEHQAIRPGAVNLMTAGRGIVHSERAGGDLQRESSLHGIQTWMALPEDAEDCEPAFAHFPADSIPAMEDDAVSVSVMIGRFRGAVSPVACRIPTLYLDARLATGGELVLPREVEEVAVYVISGQAIIDGETLERENMAVPEPGARIASEAGCHVLIVGGDAVGPRHVWWNFVSSSRERIRQAADQWRNGDFPVVPGDETEFIPLPD